MEPLTWRVHPAARYPARTALLILIISMIGGAIAQITGSLLYPAIAMAVFLGSLVPYFIPTVYTIDITGVTQRRPGRVRHLEWNEIRHISTGKNRVYLSPVPPRIFRRDPGLLLLCPDNYLAVVDTIEKVRSHQQMQNT